VPNVTNQRGVLILDTAADNIVAAGGATLNPNVKIYAAKFIAIVGGQATITDAGSSQARAEFSAITNGADFQIFNPPLLLNGLRLLAITATDRLYVYTGQ
jgi:hypothetical protein